LLKKQVSRGYPVPLPGLHVANLKLPPPGPGLAHAVRRRRWRGFSDGGAVKYRPAIVGKGLLHVTRSVPDGS